MDMNTVRKVFTDYNEILIKQNTLLKTMISYKTKGEWNDFTSTMSELQINQHQLIDHLFGELNQILSIPMTDELADLIYELSMEIYRTELNDYLWLERVYQVLIPYYEQNMEANIEKLIWLYNCDYYVENEVKYRQYNLLSQSEFKSLDKLISLRSYYDTIMDRDTRYRFFAAYYNKILNGLEKGSISATEGYRLVDEMLSFYNSPMVQDMDGNDERIKSTITTLKYRSINVVYTILSEDAYIKRRFCDVVDELFKEVMQTAKSINEVPATLYAGYLVTSYIRNQNQMDEIFDLYMDYFLNGCMGYQDAESTTMDEISFYLDCVEILSSWAGQIENQDKIKKMLATFTVIAEKKYKNVPIDELTYLNILLKNLCIQMIRFGAFATNPEDCIQQMILNRNFYLYSHSHRVEKISHILVDAIYEKNPRILMNYASVPKDSFQQKVGNHALFHDIGKCDMYEIIHYHNRFFTEEEKKHIANHTRIGYEFLDQFDTLRQYQDTVLYHHHDYADETIQCKISDDRILVDIVHIADSIDGTMAKMVNRKEDVILETVFAMLTEGRGSVYHPDLVDLLLDNSAFIEYVHKVVNESDYERMEEFVRNFEVVSIKRDFEEYCKELDQRAVEVFNTRRFEELNPYLDRLFEIAAESNSSRNMGIAYYKMTEFYYAQKEIQNCLNSAYEAVRFLEVTEEYTALGHIYNMLGLIMQTQYNFENSIGYFLKSIEYSKLASNDRRILVSMNNVACIFKQMGNYERALYYFHCSLEYANELEIFVASIYYNMIYCYCMLHDKSNLIKYFQLAEEARKIYEYEDFEVYIYSAIAGYELGDSAIVEENLIKAKDSLNETNNYSLAVQEIYIYLDFLYRLGRYEELLERIDFFLDYFGKNAYHNRIITELLLKKVDCSLVLEDYDSLEKTVLIFDSIGVNQRNHRANVAIQTEKAYRQKIQNQRKQRAMLKTNKRLEKEVIEAKQENAAKSSFLNSMSHEIRTPIHAILGLDEMIMRECQDETILQYASDIQNAGKTLIGIINDILDFSKMESGQMDIHAKNYMITDVIRELNNMIESRAKDKGLLFAVHCDAQVPKVLYGDDLRIKQVILNVLTNAVKYTEKGRVDFSIQSEKLSEDSISLIVSVKDTGMGMRKEDLEKLSTPYARFDEGKNRNIEGTGLGMNIVKTLINQMEGNLLVESEYGKGSLFVITIPQKVIEWTGVGTEDTSKKKVDESKRKALFIAPEAEILLVDDNAVNLKVVSSLLKRTKVNVTTAKSGFECLKIAEEKKFHVILLDHRMPEMDGVETLKNLKQNQGINVNTPTVALTANAVTGAADFYKENGFDELITKPVDYVELEKKLMSLLPTELFQLL